MVQFRKGIHQNRRLICLGHSSGPDDGELSRDDILLLFAYTGCVFNAASSGLPNAWVVKCKKCWTAFRYSPAEVFKGRPSPSNTCSAHRREETAINNPEEKRSNAAILIAASLIAAVRLNKEEIRPSPSVTTKIADSIRLAEMIQAKLRH